MHRSRQIFFTFDQNLDFRKIPPPPKHGPQSLLILKIRNVLLPLKCLSCCRELRCNKNGWLDVLRTQWFHRFATDSISSLHRTTSYSGHVCRGLFAGNDRNDERIHIWIESWVSHWSMLPFFSHVMVHQRVMEVIYFKMEEEGGGRRKGHHSKWISIGRMST